MVNYSVDEVKQLLESILNTKLKRADKEEKLKELIVELKKNVKIDKLSDYFSKESIKKGVSKKDKKAGGGKKKLNLKEIVNRVNSGITVTLCDTSENHTGMKQNGKKGVKDDAFDYNDLMIAKKKFENKGFKCEMKHLNKYCKAENIPKGKDFEDAYILIVKKGVECLLDKKGSVDDLFNELTKFDWDTKYFDVRRNAVLDKWARANVCFSEEGHEPNYEEKKGTMIAYNDVPLTKQIRDSLKEYIGKKGENLEAEGNLYYKKDKCGIGFHGDAERVKVIGVRLGSMPLVYQWYFNSKPIGEKCVLELDDSDIYFMSAKAVGNDWKCRSKVTLRHAAGCNYYTKLDK